VRPVATCDITAAGDSRFHFVQGEQRGDALTLQAIDPSGEVLDWWSIPRRPP
jgi:hypothetical protein